MAEKTPTRFALFWQKNGWFGLILIAAALLLFGIAAILTAAAEREESAAIATEGTVAALVVIEPGQRLSSADAYDQTSYSVHVDFTVDGQEYRASQSIEEEDFEQFTKGQTIPVRYLPDDPNRIWVASDIEVWPSDLRFLGYILLILGLFLAWGPWVVAGNELKKMRL